MQNYLNLLSEIKENGEWRENRTGVKTKALFVEKLKFDLRDGFPAVTTKKLAFKTVAAELIGFIRGYDNAADFRELGCTIWDPNANENKTWLLNPERKGDDDLGSIYGVQWRRWKALHKSENGKPVIVVDYIDQLQNAIDTIVHDPDSRRIIVSAWNPADIHRMALPPCHLLYQFNAPGDEWLDVAVYQRSCDMFLGVPFNIASYALLLEMVAFITKRKPRHLTWIGADVHIYENHFDVVDEQLQREPKPLPKLTMVFDAADRPIPTSIDQFEPEDFVLDNYEHYPSLKADMAV